MALLTVAQLKEHVETDLSYDVLDLLLSEAEQLINRTAGDPTASTETHLHDPREANTRIWLKQKAATITTVTERGVDGVETVLAGSDYRLMLEGRVLERIDAAWAPEVRIAYSPVNDLVTRKRIQVDLVKLAIQYEALGSSSIGSDVSQSHLSYQAEREKLLRGLVLSMRAFA